MLECLLVLLFSDKGDGEELRYIVQILRYMVNYYVLIVMKYSISNSILNSVTLKKKHPDSLGIQVLSFSSLPYTLAAAATSAA